MKIRVPGFARDRRKQSETGLFETAGSRQDSRQIAP